MLKEKVVGIGEVKVFRNPVIITCHGLGSCVGLFIKDRATGVSGGAHIFLPHSGTDSIISSMMDTMKLYGSNLEGLRAKVTGGAHMMVELQNTGEMIIQSVKKQLNQKGIYIAAMDVGGTYSRSAKFNSVNETLSVKVNELKTTKIL